MDKSLYQAPQGLEALDTEPGIEIEIEDPEAVRIGIDGMEIEIEPGKETSGDFNANLAEEMDERDLQLMSSELLGEYESDLNGRKDWIDTYVKGLKLLGVKYEERSTPWIGACGVFHPLLMESAVKFQSETIMETFPAAGPVKTQVLGKDTKEKAEAAIRVSEDMNHELTEVMVEYRPEHERMLFSLCLSGNAFKKVYFDPAINRQVAVFIPAEDIVVPYGAMNLESAERVTHRMRKTENEILRLQDAGFYRDVDLGEPTRTIEEVEKQKAKEQGLSAEMDDRFQLLEMHVDLDLKGYEDTDKHGEPTGIALPFVVTIEKGTGEVLAIRRNWKEEDDLKLKRQHFVHYSYVPGFGFYAFGLIHMVGGHATSSTSILRQLVDAGTLANLPGGLKTRGLRIKGDDTPIPPGEFRDVDIPGGVLKDNIMLLPYKEPSQTLVALLNQIVEDGRRFAAVADLKTSDMSGQSPVGTTLAILERMLKVMSAVQARIHYTMKQEFRLLRDIIRDNTPEEYDYEPEVGSRKAKRADYDLCTVLPVSDPNASTMAQKVVQYQAVMQLAQGAPQLYNLPLLHRQIIETLGIKNAEKLVPTDDDQKPADPVTENMAIMNGKPVKAFIYQNHEAHIGVHMAAMKDPKLAAIMGQNPMAQQMQAAAMAHISEHLAFAYRSEIEKQLGAAMPSPEENLTPEVEVQLSMLVAKAAQQLLAKNSAEDAQMKVQQAQQDPLIQMQQAELQLKQDDNKRKAQKDMLDMAAKADQIRVEEERIASQERIAQAQLAAKQEADGVRMGIEIGKHKSDKVMQLRQQQQPQQQPAVQPKGTPKQ
jgi:hypothetical protein